MQHSKIVTLDKMNSIDLNIYEVDGLHGTLKELSDYFNVDTIAVSDLILSGLTIQDALVMAPKNKVIGAAFIDNIEQNLETMKKSKKKLEKSTVSKKSTVEKKPAKSKVEKKLNVSVDKQDQVLNSEELHYLTDNTNLNSPVAVKTVSDYQEMDDLLIVTTTTTVVYRRR